MNYEEITQRISELLKIPNEKFNLDFNKTKLYNVGIGCAKSDRFTLVKGYDEIEYEYIHFWSERWKGINLFITLKTFKKNLSELNYLIHSFNSDIIDLESSKSTYYYLDNSFAVFTVFIYNDFIEMRFAKSDYIN